MKDNINIKILDCTLRDGGYLNNWYFDTKMAREVYRSLSKSGVDIIEIGFRGSEKYFSRETYGAWRFTEDSLIQEVISGIDGPQIAVMGDYGKIEEDDFCAADQSPVSIVRLAVHKNNLKPCVKLLEKIKEKGYRVSLNAMGYTNYTSDERKDLVSLINDSNIDILFMADSYGSIFPDQMNGLAEPLLKLENVELGFHPHNNLQMAFANSLKAIELGFQIIDGTLNGIGRGAGNLPIEVMLLYMELSRGEKYNVIPVLNFIDAYLLPLQKELQWGYQLPYMLSGMYKCHANYIKNLLKLKQYNIEDICIAMERISEADSVGFSQDVLDTIINEGIIGASEIVLEDKIQTPASIPYVDRHQNKDFLILANGPSLLEYKSSIDQFIAKYDPILMGANNLSGLFTPHYHAFNNKRRFSMYVDTVNERSNLLISQYFPEEFIREYTDRAYESIFYRDKLDVDFDIIDGVIQSNCRTISVLLLGVAVAMGAERVFAVGLDGYMQHDKDQIHFYKEVMSQTDDDILIELHQLSQKYISQIDQYLINTGKEGINILTPTSYRKFYKGIENYL